MKLKKILKKLSPEKAVTLLATVAIVTGIFFRFYNLTWGTPYFFHPDERNIASSVSQLSYPERMNPHFFAYGTLPIYAIYFVGTGINVIQNFILKESVAIQTVGFEQAIIIGRCISLILSCLLVYITYLVGQTLSKKRGGLISAGLLSLSVGLIQYTHFMTFEMWLTFFTFFLIYLLIKYAATNEPRYILYLGGILGILVSTKISSLFLLPPTIFLLLSFQIKRLFKVKKFRFIFIEKELLKIILLISITAIITYLSCSYYWLDQAGFFNSIDYETSVAIGKLMVFYTQTFISSPPIFYQLAKVYPFILNPFMLIASLVSIPVVLLMAFKSKSKILLILLVFFSVTFFSQAFLYVKWVRYYIPTLPFLYIFIEITIGFFLSNKNRPKIKKLSHIFTILLFLISFLYAFSYFKTVLLAIDARVQAASWAQNHISSTSTILAEVYDMGIVPFNQYFSKITLLNFYDLEADPAIQEELHSLTQSTNYIILPSQRIYESRISQPLNFPSGNAFYQQLLSNKLPFSEVYSTPCDIFCKILYLGDPAFSFEQTANVFDRPTIRIFKHE